MFNARVPIYRRKFAHESAREAKRIYESLAMERVDPEPFRRLGDCYSLPWIGACEKDDEEAVRYYREAHALGDGEATFNLGYYYDHIAKNATQAMYYYHLALEDRYAYYPAMLSLVWMHVRLLFVQYY